VLTQEQARTLVGATAYNPQGDKLGKIGQVYLDEQTGQPEFATVATGLFGMNETFVPLAQADLRGDDQVVLPYDKDQIKDAPNIDPAAAGGQGLTQDQEATLYRYYGMEYSDQRSGTGLPEQDPQYTNRASEGEYRGDSQSSARRDRPASDDAMTRSEERLRVGTEQQEAGRARLRKYVVTENVEQTVPVSREEVRVEREPITDANRDAALSGPDISEAEHEVTLREERPVVQTEAVPVERVRLEKDTVTDTETVGGDIRKERIDTEGIDDPDRR